MRIKIDNDMKRIFTLMLLSLAVVMGGCEKDNTYEDPGLDVSLYNIAGVWKLAARPFPRRYSCSSEARKRSSQRMFFGRAALSQGRADTVC